MSNEYLLLAAIRSHDFQAYLENTSSEDIYPVKHQTCLLFIALTYHNTQVALDLIHRGFDVNFRDPFGDTPLHLAAVYGNPEVTRELLERGAQVDFLDFNFHTPLYYAVYYANEDTEIVRLLMQYHSDPHSLNVSPNSIMDLAKNKHRQDLIEIMQNPPPLIEKKRSWEQFKRSFSQIYLKTTYFLILGCIGTVLFAIPDFEFLPVWEAILVWGSILFMFISLPQEAKKSHPIQYAVGRYLVCGFTFALSMNYLLYFFQHTETSIHVWVIVLPLILLYLTLFILPAFDLQRVHRVNQKLMGENSIPFIGFLVFLFLTNLFLVFGWLRLFPQFMSLGTLITALLAEDCLFFSYLMALPFGETFWETILHKEG
jgi:hypothetical protein